MTPQRRDEVNQSQLCDDSPVFAWDAPLDRSPVVSAGLSTRINLLGFAVMEIYYAYPFQRPVKGAHFGFQLAPGW